MEYYDQLCGYPRCGELRTQKLKSHLVRTQSFKVLPGDTISLKLPSRQVWRYYIAKTFLFPIIVEVTLVRSTFLYTATRDCSTLHNTLSLVHAATGDYSTLHSTLSLVLCCLDTRPRGLTFSWWGRYGLCHRHKPTKLAHSFLFCSCVYFCLCGLFNSISFHKFSRQLFAFSLSSPCRISAF